MAAAIVKGILNYQEIDRAAGLAGGETHQRRKIFGGENYSGKRVIKVSTLRIKRAVESFNEHCHQNREMRGRWA